MAMTASHSALPSKFMLSCPYVVIGSFVGAKGKNLKKKSYANLLIRMPGEKKHSNVLAFKFCQNFELAAGFRGSFFGICLDIFFYC